MMKLVACSALLWATACAAGEQEEVILQLADLTPTEQTCDIESMVAAYIPVDLDGSTTVKLDKRTITVDGTADAYRLTLETTHYAGAWNDPPADSTIMLDLHRVPGLGVSRSGGMTDPDRIEGTGTFHVTYVQGPTEPDYDCTQRVKVTGSISEPFPCAGDCRPSFRLY